jgi:hypothetical protein
LITRWSKQNQQTARRAIEAAAQADQDTEYRAARTRMRAALDEATMMLPVLPPAKAAPLLTRGQSAHTQR